MGPETLADLLATRESRTHERKRDLSSLPRTLQTIVAFANTAGGILVVGQEDDGTVLGLQDAEQDCDRLANAVREGISPSLLPDIDIVRQEGQDLLRVGVAQTPGPYHLSAEGPEDGVYVRLGATTRHARQEEVERLRREAEAVAFDLRPCLGSEINDLDLDAVERAFSTLGREVDRSGLLTMGLLVRHGDRDLPSVGGVILFGQPAARARYFPQAQVVCARFAGTTKSEFLDNLDIEGSVLDALLGKDVPSFVRRNTRTMSMIPGMVPGIENVGMVMPGYARTDVTEFPAVAMREALVNAVAHADYSQRGMAIRVAIFSDRLEIESPGDLPTGLRLEDLKAGISRIRNPVITRVLKELGLMERWGSGFKRIRESCEEGGYPVPEWEELGTVTRVVFAPHPQVAVAGQAPSRHQDGTKSGPSRDQVAPRSESSRDQVGTKSGPSRDQVNKQITLAEAKGVILQFASTPASLALIMEQTRHSNKTKFRRKYIKPLLAAGLLAMTIPDKPKSRLQKYQTTPKGLLALEEATKPPDGEPTLPAEESPPPKPGRD